jgi:glycosyltransferase involved in cell wall biosynthesis
MIVKNEAHVIHESFDCIRKYINYYVIVDTGSTDDTKKVIKEYFDKHGIEGEIHDRPWKNFGWNRTEAFKCAKGKGDYVWVIDADDVIHGDLVLPDELTDDSYQLLYGNDFTYWRAQIFKNTLDWTYKGVLHEYPNSVDQKTSGQIEGNYWVESRRLGDRNKVSLEEKMKKDVALLLGGLKDEPDNERYWFYLGQSYKDGRNYEKAIEAYDKRISMGRWIEEHYFAIFQKAHCYLELGDWTKAHEIFLEAHNLRPERAEPLYEIAKYYRENKKFALGYVYAKAASEIDLPKGDILFVSKDVYDWKSWDERSVCAFYLGKHSEAFNISVLLLEQRRDRIPDYQINRLQNNKAYGAEHILNNNPLEKYNELIVQKLLRSNKENKKEIEYHE